MKNIVREILDFVVKNKYIITFVVIVVFLYAIGLLKLITEVLILIVLVILALYFGKKLQDKNFKIKDIFNKSKNGEFTKEGNVYYYEPSKDKDKNNKKEDK